MNNSYLFISFAIPDKIMFQEFKKDKYPAIQTHIFIWNFIKSIEETQIFKTQYISSRPVSNYPNYSKIFIKGGRSHQIFKDIKIEINEISFINFSFLKFITRFLNTFILSFYKLIKNRNNNGIIVYSVHVPYMLSAYLLSKIFRKKIIHIWGDPPALNRSNKKKFKNRIRLIELKISKFLMHRVDKVIVVSEHLAKDFAPQAKYLVIEGIIDQKVFRGLDKTTNNNKIVVDYTGTVIKEYGLENIINAFIRLNDNDYKLMIYGSGDYVDEIKLLSKQYSFINYMGVVKHEDSLKAQTNADFLINMRSPEDSFTKYSFPFKLLEYMSSGTPVISTMLPGMSSEYAKYLIVVEDNKVETIVKKLIEIKKYTNDQKKNIAYEAYEFIKLNKNSLIQGEKIRQFIDS